MVRKVFNRGRSHARIGRREKSNIPIDYRTAKPKVEEIRKILISFIALLGACSITNHDNNDNLLEKQLLSQQVIVGYEGFLPVAKHDGFDKKGNPIYTNGFGTRAKPGQKTNINKASRDMGRHLIDKTFPMLDPGLPINKYVAYASFLYSTSFGKQPKSCEDILIRKYQNPGTKYEKGLVRRRREEYNLCKKDEK